MTKTELKNAFREAVSYDFKDVPQDDTLIKHEFSQKFERKMQKLIKKEESVFWHFVNTSYKRIAVLVLVFMMLFTTACSIESIKEPVLRFLVKIYETFIEYTFEGEGSSAITKEYQITLLPDGFIQTDCFKDSAGITTTYENKSGDKIIFYQTITKETDISVDSEYTDTEIVDILGLDVNLYLREDISVAFWIKDTYLLKIVCHGNFNEQSILDVVKNIK